jgi:hypothetical protein
MVDIVPSLGQTLLSGSKFADAGYTVVYDKAEVNFYDANTIHITKKAVLTGYRCTHTGLWHIPLQPVIMNENDDTLVLDSTCGHHSTNTCYKVPPTTRIMTTYVHHSSVRNTPSSMYMNFQALSKQSDTSMQQQGTQQKTPGSQPSVMATTVSGHSSTPRM